MFRHPSGVAGEVLRCAPSQPPSLARHPSGQREVVHGHDGRDAEVEAALEQPLVVVQRRPGEVPGLRLDAGPLEREPVGGQPQLGEQGDVLGVAVVVVACITRRLDET